jgi:hypothetical protein
MELTNAARATLVNSVGRQGAKVRGTVPVLALLFECGLVSRAGNLTAKGVAERARVFDEMTEIKL